MADKTAAPEEPAIKLGRVGHLFTPTGVGPEVIGDCRTALVTDVNEDEQGPLVTIAWWTQTGAPDNRQFVHVAAPSEDGPSFHLNRDCPWSR